MLHQIDTQDTKIQETNLFPQIDPTFIHQIKRINNMGTNKYTTINEHHRDKVCHS